MMFPAVSVTLIVGVELADDTQTPKTLVAFENDVVDVILLKFDPSNTGVIVFLLFNKLLIAMLVTLLPHPLGF